MKYEITVQVALTPVSDHGLRIGGQNLELRESNTVELSTLSDAAALLVKLHEFFEVIRKRGAL